MANQSRQYSIAFAIGAKLASNFSNTFSNATKAINTLANTALAFAGISFGVDGIKEVVSGYAEFEQSMANLQNQSGLTSKELEAVSNSAMALFENNYGESISDIADSMANISQQTKLSGNELENFTKNALMMQETFDFATDESTRAVNQMMKSFNASGEEAFNLLAQGAQNGLNANGDLMDWVNEYSVHFAQMGFSAEEMFNMVGNGADSGVFQVEKLGDAIKEFGIRSKDSSKGTLEAFENLGLNSEQITKDFAAGGKTAKVAFDQVTDAIFKMDDAVLQDQVGVALFGTMWEDLGKESIKALSNITGEFNATKQTMSEINDIKYSTLQGSWDGLLRKVDAIKIKMGEMISPALKDFINIISDKLPKGFELLCNTTSKLKVIAGNTFNRLKAKIQENKPLIESVGRVVNDVQEKFNGLKEGFIEAFNSPQSVLNNLSQNVLPAVLDGIMWMVEKSADLYHFINNNWSTIGPIVLGIAAAIATYKGVTLAAKSATAIYTAVTKGMTIAQGALNTVMNLSPLAKWSIVIGAAVAAGIYLYKNWDTIKLKATQVWATIQGVFGGIGAWFQNKWNSVLQVTTSIWNNVVSFLSTLPIGQGILQNITNMIHSAKTIFSGIIDFLTGVFTGNWTQAWEGIKGIVSGVFSGLGAVVTAPINVVIGVINGLIEKVNGINIKIPDWVPGIGGQSYGVSIPQIPMFAKGSTGFNTPDTFIAGEKGAELVTNAKGYKVFNNRETLNLLDNSNKFSSNSVEVSDFSMDVTGNQSNLGKETLDLLNNSNRFSNSVDGINTLSLDGFREKQATFGSELTQVNSGKEKIEILFNPQITINGSGSSDGDLAQLIINELMKYEPALIKKILQIINNKSLNDRRLRYEPEV